MRAHFAIALLAATSLAISCNTEKADDGKTASTEPPPNSVVESADGLTFYTPEFEIPAGDSQTCIYTNYSTTKDWSVVSGDGVQGQGGHHILLMYANDPRPVGVHPCVDADMINLNQISGSAGEGNTQLLGLPQGLAIKVPQGKQIVMQAHYINTTGAAHMTRDWAKMITEDPSKVKAYVNYLVTNDDAFEIPPNAPLARTTTCAIDRDYQVALALPHMHNLGQHYKLEILDETGALVDTPIETDWQPLFTSHPPVQSWTMDAPFMLHKGQTLRQTCTWDNTSANPVLFPDEMCLSFFYYWPGNGDIVCDMKEATP